MKQRSSVSIIIPAYNEQHQLRRCLEAIAAQTVAPREVIVVDNNSRDRTAEVAGSFSFVTLLEERQQGIVYARNRGFNAAKGEIIARIDADTRLPANWVAYVGQRAAELLPDVAVTGPCTFRHTPPLIVFWLHRLVYFWSSQWLFRHPTLFGSNMFLPRSLWQKVRDDVCLRTDIHEDMDLAAHIVAHGGTVLFDPKLRASISNRRWWHWFHYPRMWLMTRYVHRP